MGKHGGSFATPQNSARHFPSRRGMCRREWEDASFTHQDSFHITTTPLCFSLFFCCHTVGCACNHHCFLSPCCRTAQQALQCDLIIALEHPSEEQSFTEES